MGHGKTSANQLTPGHLTGVPKSGLGPGALDQYEYGTVSGLSATGRYKVFATPFSARPIVTLGAVRSAGSSNALLYGTPAAGSFRARMDRVGSTTVTFIAMGQR